MGLTDLLIALKKMLIKCTASMSLKVNPDTGDHEEDYEMPLYQEEYDDDTEPEQSETVPESPAPRKEENRPPHIFLMNTPERSDLTSQIPYLMIQLLSGEDKQDSESREEESKVKIRILIALYDDDGENGALQVLEIIERIRIMLLKGRLLDRQYMIQSPFDYEIYQDDTGVYYLGEINTVWSVPVIERTEYFIEETM